jgi:hypothetical protein
MHFDREYVSLVMYKQRQQELIKEAEKQRLVNISLDFLRRERRNQAPAQKTR